MAAEALPAPTTMSLPRGGSGRCGGTHSAGCADAMAASNMFRSNTRGAEVLLTWCCSRRARTKDVHQRADSIDIHLDGATILDRSDADGGAARDHVAGQQRHVVGNAAHQFLRRYDHVRQWIVLTLHPIEPRDHPCVPPFQSRCDD